MFCKKGVLRNFEKFTGKHLCQSPFFNKVAGLRPSWHRCFLVNLAKFLRTPFLTEHLWETAYVNKSNSPYIAKQVYSNNVYWKCVIRKDVQVFPKPSELKCN